jgi:ABC-type molybdate transport system substrate-binding protein
VQTRSAYGPTPTLAKNIVDGAPADIFLSADVVWMDYLAERKLIRDETKIDVVHNEIVLVQGANRAKAQTVTVGPSFPIVDIVGSGPIAMCNPGSHSAGRYPRLRLTLDAKLPLQWKPLGDSMRRSFDVLAESISAGNSTKESLAKLSQVMTNCVACHTAYRLVTTRN